MTETILDVLYPSSVGVKDQSSRIPAKQFLAPLTSTVVSEVPLLMQVLFVAPGYSERLPDACWPKTRMSLLSVTVFS